jgi:hypothetical protein
MPGTEQKHESEITGAVQANGSPNHRDSFKRRKISNGLDAAIRQLYDPPISRVTLLNLFDNRASFASITAWRFGWNAPPDWAADLLKAKLRARAAELLHHESTITARKGPHGWRGAETLAKWRERQSRVQTNSVATNEVGELWNTPGCKSNPSS